MARWKARGRLLISVVELFHQLSRLRRCERILIEIVVFERSVGHFERKFQGDGGLPPTTFGVRKHGAITWRYLRDPTISRFDTIPACDRQTHRHTMTANTRASLAPRE